MAASPRDVEHATLIVNDLLDQKKYPCGNSIGSKQWGKAASLITGDPSERGYWTQHGDTCLTKASQNIEMRLNLDDRMLKYKETERILQRIQPEIVNEIRRDLSFPSKYPKFFRMFPKYENMCFAAAKSGQKRRCHYCQVDIPSGKDFQSVVHESGDCASKRSATDWISPTATSATLGADADYIMTNLKTREGVPLVNEPDVQMVTFRCNDHAAIMVTQLYRIGTGPHFEVIRIGEDSSNCHYYVVIGRRLREGEDEDHPLETDLMLGSDGTPLGVFGEDAIIMDPWATKHDPLFSRVAIGMKGINHNVRDSNKWMVQPISFGNKLFSVCLFD